WYDDANFHDSDETEISLARLTVGDDGAAQVLLAGGEARQFENEDEATLWLRDEEYSRLNDLPDGQAAAIRPPLAGSDEELARKMNLKMEKKRSPRVA